MPIDKRIICGKKNVFDFFFSGKCICSFKRFCLLLCSCHEFNAMPRILAMIPLLIVPSLLNNSARLRQLFMPNPNGMYEALVASDGKMVSEQLLHAITPQKNKVVIRNPVICSRYPAIRDQKKIPAVKINAQSKFSYFRQRFLMSIFNCLVLCSVNDLTFAL